MCNDNKTAVFSRTGFISYNTQQTTTIIKKKQACKMIVRTRVYTRVTLYRTRIIYNNNNQAELAFQINIIYK